MLTNKKSSIKKVIVRKIWRSIQVDLDSTPKIFARNKLPAFSTENTLAGLGQSFTHSSAYLSYPQKLMPFRRTNINVIGKNT